MQIILSSEEIETIYEALLTDHQQWKTDQEISIINGRGEFEKQPLKRLEQLMARFSPYIRVKQ